jgi:hypothetical protein
VCVVDCLALLLEQHLDSGGGSASNKQTNRIDQSSGQMTDVCPKIMIPQCGLEVPLGSAVLHVGVVHRDGGVCVSRDVIRALVG